MFSLFLISVALLLVYFLYQKQRKQFQYWKEKSVPCPTPVPFFGNLLPVLLRREALASIFLRVYKQFQGHRYFGFYQFSRKALVIRDIDLIKQICIKDFNKFSDHSENLPKDADPFWKKGLFARDGEDWHDMRILLSPAFSSSKMKAMFCLMAECAEKFANHFYRQGSQVIALNMKEAFTKFTNDATASCAFGIKCDSLKHPSNEFFVMGKEAFDFSGLKGLKLFGAALYPALAKLFKITMFGERANNFFKTIVKETIEYRERSGIIRPDLLHILREVQKGRLQPDDESIVENDKWLEFKKTNGKETESGKKAEITDEDIAIQAAVFFFGGYDTVSLALCNVAHQLAIEPDVQDKLIKEIDDALATNEGKLTYATFFRMPYLDMVITETLRLWTPAFFLNRICVQPYTIEPVLPGETPLTIEIGTEIIIPVLGIQRDPQYYKNPNKFDPERFHQENKHNIDPTTFIPFGIGPRKCIGNRFALLEMKTILFYLLSKFRIVPVEQTSRSYILDTSSINILKKGGYWLGLQPRV